MKGASKFEPSSSKIVFDDSEDDDEEQSLSSMSSSDEEEEEEKGKELTLEEIHKLRADGSRAVRVKPDNVKRKGRANKNRPVEMSSKRPVSRYREVVQVPRKVVRDPRFDSLAGNVDPEGFRKRYSFFFEEKLPVEREELKKKLKKTKNPEEVEELKDQLSYVEKWLKYDPSRDNKGKTILAEHKKKEREAAKMGKIPYYLNNLKSESKHSSKSTTVSRNLGSLHRFLTNGGRRMQQRTSSVSWTMFNTSPMGSCATSVSLGKDMRALVDLTTKEFVAKMELKPGQKVLDVGFGIGGGDFYMAESFDVHVVGIKLSVSMISFALERAIRLKCSGEFEVADCNTKHVRITLSTSSTAVTLFCIFKTSRLYSRCSSSGLNQVVKFSSRTIARVLKLRLLYWLSTSNKEDMTSVMFKLMDRC